MEALIGKIFTVDFIEENYEKVKLILTKERSNNSLVKQIYNENGIK